MVKKRPPVTPTAFERRLTEVGRMKMTDPSAKKKKSKKKNRKKKKEKKKKRKKEKPNLLSVTVLFLSGRNLST